MSRPSVAQVAKALFDHDNAGQSPEWRESVWCDMGGSEPAEERAQYELRAAAVLALFEPRADLCGEPYRDVLPPGFVGEYTCERPSGHAHHQSGNLAWPAGTRTVAPATVTTVAELDALPVGSVVLDSDGDVWQRRGVDARWASANPAWAYVRLSSDDLPATVLHRGGDR